VEVEDLNDCKNIVWEPMSGGGGGCVMEQGKPPH
jgi:hypothetical protein